MPINEVTREWYGTKATPRQRSAYDEILVRMQNHRSTKDEADKILNEWVKEQRSKIAKRKAAEDKAKIEAYIQEQVVILTTMLEKEGKP